MTLLPSAIGNGRFRRSALAAEEVGAVGQDGDGVAAAGEIERCERVLADREAGFGDAGRVDEGEDGAVADGDLAVDADQSPIAPPVVESFLLELGQGSRGRDRLDRGGHAGHATVPGLDLLACGGFARACHQIILRRVVQGEAKLQ